MQHHGGGADVLPVTSEWVNRLRNRGFAAYLSGAGPTAMVLHTEPIDENILRDARDAGLRVIPLEVAGPDEVKVVQA